MNILWIYLGVSFTFSLGFVLGAMWASRPEIRRRFDEEETTGVASKDS